jgi:Tfp pilus assembly protein PilN
MIEKSGFVVNVPFQKWRKFWVWATVTVLIIIVEFLFLSWWLWQSWQEIEKVQLQKNGLHSSLAGYDEIVRKKNKLVARRTNQIIALQDGSRAQQISRYLAQLEQAVPVGVQLEKLNFLESKIELIGVSQNLSDLSVMISNLQKLEFVVELLLEQVVVKELSVLDQYQFTINLKLQEGNLHEQN